MRPPRAAAGGVARYTNLVVTSETVAPPSASPSVGERAADRAGDIAEPRGRARLLPLAMACTGGAVFALATPPTDLYPLAFAGLTLLGASLDRAPGAARAFGRAAAWATVAGLVGLRFVPAVVERFTTLGSFAAYAALVLLAAAQSLVWGAGGALVAVLRRRARAPLELALPAGVLLACSLPTVFAWTPAGLLTPWPALVQLGDLVGERGVSAVFALVAALAVRATTAAFAPKAARRAREAALATTTAAALMGALLLHGTWRMAAIARATEAAPTVRIGLVNQAVEARARWDEQNHDGILRALRRLTRRAESQGAELTVWPEAAYPYALDHEARRAPRGANAMHAGGVHGPLLVGYIGRGAPREIAPGVFERGHYNSATIVTPDGAMQPPYDKLELLWFGETVPFGSQLPWLRRLFQRSGGILPGDAPRALELARPGSSAARLGVLNCYEDTLAGVGRRIASVDPDLLVNVTNDAWFAGSAEPELHARLAVMRAVELRRDLVRAVNLGVASWVDARGIVRARDDRSEPSVLLVEPALRRGPPTPYARVGDLPLALALAGGAAFFAIRARSPNRRRRHRPTESPRA